MRPPSLPQVLAVALLGGMVCWFYSMDPAFWRRTICSWFRRDRS